jgi:hypothetical protein
MKYVILGAEEAEALDKLVNDAIADGWEPLGGVAVATCFKSWENSRKGYSESQTDYTWAQAMIKRTDQCTCRPQYDPNCPVHPLRSVQPTEPQS